MRGRPRVRGRVVDATGRAVAGAAVNAMIEARGPRALLPTEGSVRVTDADGRFDLRLPWVGPAQLRVWRDKGSGAQRSIDLTEGSDTEMEIALR